MIFPTYRRCTAACKSIFTIHPVTAKMSLLVDQPNLLDSTEEDWGRRLNWPQQLTLLLGERQMNLIHPEQCDCLNNRESRRVSCCSSWKTTFFFIDLMSRTCLKSRPTEQNQRLDVMMWWNWWVKIAMDKASNALLPAFVGLQGRLVQSNKDVLAEAKLELIVQGVQNPRGCGKWEDTTCTL